MPAHQPPPSLHRRLRTVRSEGRRQRGGDRVEAADAHRLFVDVLGALDVEAAPARHPHFPHRAVSVEDLEPEPLEPSPQIGAVVADTGKRVETARRETRSRAARTPPGRSRRARRGERSRRRGRRGARRRDRARPPSARDRCPARSGGWRRCEDRGAWRVRRTLDRSKCALSSSTRRVDALTSVASPPMTPASATARAPSATTRSAGTNSRVAPSSVWSASPGCGRPDHDGRRVQRVEIEGVERLAHLPQHEVGDVDHVVDRPHGDRFETAHQPVRARAQSHLLEHPRRVARAEGRLGHDHAGERRGTARRFRAGPGRERADRHRAGRRSRARGRCGSCSRDGCR